MESHCVLFPHFIGVGTKVQGDKSELSKSCSYEVKR